MSFLDWPEVPVQGTAVYSDEHIERCGDEFEARQLALRGITFAQYVADPQRYADAALEMLPLLGRQRRVQRRVEALENEALAVQAYRYGEPLDLTVHAQRVERGLEDFPRREGRIVEPLHHHRHPRNNLADFTYRRSVRR